MRKVLMLAVVLRLLASLVAVPAAAEVRHLPGEEGE